MVTLTERSRPRPVLVTRVVLIPLRIDGIRRGSTVFYNNMKLLITSDLIDTSAPQRKNGKFNVRTLGDLLKLIRFKVRTIDHYSECEGHLMKYKFRPNKKD